MSAVQNIQCQQPICPRRDADLATISGPTLPAQSYRAGVVTNLPRIVTLSEEAKIYVQMNNDTTANSQSCTGDDATSIEHARTTTIVNDTCEVTSDYTSIPRPPTMEVSYQSILDFLAKPILVRSGLWSTGLAQNALVDTFSIGAALTGQLYWLDKLEGFQYMRGDAVIRVQINANPFQQGKLLLNFFPCYSDLAPYVTNTNWRTVTIASRRMAPCVELDCQQTAATMTVPYITPTNYFSIKNKTYDWGQIDLSVLARQRSGASGPSTIEYLMYLSFENVELVGPSIAQGPSSQKSRIKSVAISLSEEQKLAQDRPIADSLKFVASVARGLATVPSLSPVALPAAWVSRGLAGLASWFGWSKPNVTTGTSIMSKQYARYFGNSDGDNTAQPLSLFAENAISTGTFYTHTTEDEMSFNFLKAVPTVINTITWDTTQTNGTSLLSLMVSPSALFQAGTVTHTLTTTYAVGPPIYYLSRAFGYWRGSVDIVLKFAKTNFHTGRLQITWTPNTHSGTISPDLINSMASLREIVDVRSGSEICLRLPFLQQNTYNPVNTGTVSSPSGRLDIQILTPLRCPETCSSVIDMLIYASGGPDFEFQKPVALTANALLAQMDDTIVCEPIGGERQPNYTLDHSSNCIGESFSSVKQLLNRNSLVMTSLASGATGPFIYPWHNGVQSINPTTGVATYPTIFGDPYSFISSMYLAFRGGVNITMVPLTESDSRNYRASLSSSLTSASVYLGSATPVNTYGVSPGVVTSPAEAVSDHSNGMISVRVPYYNRNKMSLLVHGYNTATSIVSAEPSQPLVGVDFPNSQISNCLLYRSFPDDFQLSYFLGCPPVFISVA